MARRQSVSFQRAPQNEPSEDGTNGKIVRYELDLDNLPPLTEAQRLEIAALAKMSDDDIDYSDIPRRKDSDLDEGVRGMFRAVKEQITIRIDADILAWLKSRGPGYQTKLNYHLGQAMERELRRAKSAAT